MGRPRAYTPDEEPRPAEAVEQERAELELELLRSENERLRRAMRTAFSVLRPCGDRA